MKRALVCGAGGFIGGHLVRRLKDEGYWVRGVDLKVPEFAVTGADDFVLLDLRKRENCWMVLASGFDEVYQLAADMGGVGFISQAECECLYNNALINLHMTDCAAEADTGRYFFSSSVCVYHDMQVDDPVVNEDAVYPALPHNEYGWEKLYSERVALACARNRGLDVRIARFENCYGSQGTWRGGREKAPAALCRKVAMARDGECIDVWGDGRASRSYNYVDDLVDAIRLLMQSEETRPTNICTGEWVTVDELAQAIIDLSGKDLSIRHVQGPVGVQARMLSSDRIRALGWTPKYTLRDGLAKLYEWVARQVGLEEWAL